MKRQIIVFAITSFLFISCNQNKSNSFESKSNIKSDSIKIDSLTKLIKRNPKKASLYANRSQLFIAQGELTNAIKDLVIANTIDSLNAEYYIELSDFYLRLGKSEVVNSLLQKGNKLIPDNRDILYRLGNLYFYIQDYNKAVEYLNQAIEIDRFYAPAYFSKGLVYYEIGKTDIAIKNFQTAVEREPDYYDAYIQLGLLYLEKSDSLALDYYENALRLSPASYEALYGKAMFYQKTKMLNDAIKTYRNILNNLDGDFPMVYFNLGYINMIYYEDYKTAISQFDSALIPEPKFIEAVYNKGFCYEQLNNQKKAIELYNQALEIQPDYDLANKGLIRLDN